MFIGPTSFKVSCQPQNDHIDQGISKEPYYRSPRMILVPKNIFSQRMKDFCYFCGLNDCLKSLGSQHFLL